MPCNDGDGDDDDDDELVLPSARTEGIAQTDNRDVVDWSEQGTGYLDHWCATAVKTATHPTARRSS
jgi:hypothetical protein